MKKYEVETSQWGACFVYAETPKKARHQAYKKWCEAYRPHRIENCFVEFVRDIFNVRECVMLNKPMIISLITIVCAICLSNVTEPSEALLQTNNEITLPEPDTLSETISTPKTYNGFTEGEEYNMRIYHYCACSKCTPGTGNTASGKRATAGMVAMQGLSFGTVIEIDGAQYTVEDRGVGAGKVDIFVNSHGEALNKGTYKAMVRVLRIGGE